MRGSCFNDMGAMTEQLTLDIRLKEQLSFANYVSSGNREPFAQLSRVARVLADERAPRERLLYLWGEPGCGKTHLLQALCRLAQEENAVRCAYVPLAFAGEFAPGLLEGFDELALVCVDDVHCIRGQAVWESALFRLCERLRGGAGVLIVSARMNPANLGLTMADLATRLGWGLVYQIRALSDEEKIVAMRLRAHNRGLQMPEQVARYLLRRYPRDTHSLFELLERIDKASLASQRRITIPFVRDLVGS
jgi:DnaA family protein